MASKKKKKSKNTLLEVLMELDPNEIVYLGTREGSCWIRIDTAEFLIENIDALNNFIKSELIRAHNSSAKYVKITPYRMVGVMDKIKETEDETELKALKQTLDGYYNRFSTTYLRERTLRNYLSKWVNVADRKVVEKYEHETDVPGTCIVIKGIESGKLWAVSEIEKLGKEYDLTPYKTWKEDDINGY